MDKREEWLGNVNIDGIVLKKDYEPMAEEWRVALNKEMNLSVTQSAGNLLSNYEILKIFLRSTLLSVLNWITLPGSVVACFMFQKFKGLYDCIFMVLKMEAVFFSETLLPICEATTSHNTKICLEIHKTLLTPNI